jgi:uncharacterized protein (DUF58 family)
MPLPTQRLAWVFILTSPIWAIAALVGLPQAAGIVLVVVIVALAALDAAALPGRGRVVVDREIPQAIGVGDLVTGSYRVTVTWPVTVRGALYDELPRAVRRETPMPQAFIARAEAPASLRVELTGRERGEWPLGRIAVRVRGPLGLMARTYRSRPQDTVLIAPSIANVRRYRLLAMQHRLRDAGVRVLRRRGEGTSFAGLREYAQGDDPRLIDWKASARRQTLITREFSVEQGQTVMIVMDCGRLMTQMADDLPRFEYALSSALVLADITRESGDHVGLLAFDDEVRAWVPPARGRGGLAALRSALIPLRASMAEPDYATAFRTLDLRQRKRSLIVFYTDVIDPRASYSLIAHTTRGARHHLPVVVALRNEALVTAAAPAGASTALGVYERAAAEELLSAREEALERMRQAGVSVIDVRPQAMTAAVVNRYLELKGRGAV